MTSRFAGRRKTQRPIGLLEITRLDLSDSLENLAANVSLPASHGSIDRFSWRNHPGKLMFQLKRV
jgi:hypothetical protein